MCFCILMQHWEIKRLQGSNNQLLNFFRANLCHYILHHKLGWNVMFWAWMFLLLFLFCKDEVTEVAFLVYANYLFKLLTVCRKEDYGCFAEKYWSLPFIVIINLVKPSKTEIIWINITVFFAGKISLSRHLWYTLEHVFVLSLKHIYCFYWWFLSLYLHMVWIQRDCLHNGPTM